MIATCPSSDRLHAFVLGHLQDQESDELYGHLAGCDSCQQQLEESGSFSDTFVGQLKSDTAEEDHTAEPALLQATDRAKNILSLLNRPAPDIAADDPAEPVPHTIGEYEIDRLIGRGGMGTVYLARHTKLGRQVALKILSRHRLADPKMQGRFSSEMKAVGRMNHPNIVAAHDAREIDGVAVLVTEYIDGLNVGSIIRRTGPLSVANAARIASEVATALAAIDTAGLIHRDIKPSNIMVSRSGAVKLLDLGLARLQTADSEHHEHRDHTATGQALGTVDYISPEQVNDGRNIDVRSDIYALGCTLFKMLTGQPVFDDTQYPTAFAKMTAHVQTPPPSVADFAENTPAPLVALVVEMLEKAPALRPQSPATLIERLSPFTGDANLADLVEQASTTEEKPRASLTPRPQTASAPTPVRSTGFSRKIPRTPFLIATALGGLLLGWAISWLMGIEITIKHPDGTTTKLNVANGSTVTIDKNGNATVELPGTASSTQSIGNQSVSVADSQLLDGIWQSSWMTDGSPGGPYQSYFVFRNGEFRRFGWNNKDRLEDPRAVNQGKFVINDQLSPKQIDFILDLESEEPVVLEGIYHFKTNNELQIEAPYDPKYRRPRDFYPKGSGKHYDRVDLSNIKTEADLPPNISPNAWRTYQQWLSGSENDTPASVANVPSNNSNKGPVPSGAWQNPKLFPYVPKANDRSPASIEAIWKIITPTELAGSYVVLTNNHFAMIGENADVTGTGSTAGWSGTFSANDSRTPAQIDFIADEPGGQFRNKSIWQIDPTGHLLLAQAKIGLQQYPKSFEAKEDSQSDFFRLRRVEFPQTDNPNELADPYASSALRTFQQFQKGIFPYDAEFTPIPKPLTDISIESLTGVWQFASQKTSTFGYVVFQNNRYVELFHGTSERGLTEVSKRSGGFSKEVSNRYHLQLKIAPDGTRRGLPMAVGINRNIDGTLKVSNHGTTSETSPKFSSWDNDQFQRVDWSTIIAPEQLPDQISRDAWQAWKELSAETPVAQSPPSPPVADPAATPGQQVISKLTDELLNGVWEFKPRSENTRGFMVMANRQYRIFITNTEPNGATNVKKTSGRYSWASKGMEFGLGLKSSNSEKQEVRLNYKMADDGDSITHISTGVAPGVPDQTPTSPYALELEIKNLARIDWSTITAPDQLPDQISRYAWQAWKDLLAESAAPLADEHPLSGIWQFSAPGRFKGAFLVLRNGHFSIVNPDGVKAGEKNDVSASGICRVNAISSPPQFDLEFKTGGPPDPQLGIYELATPDSLKVWFAAPKQERLKAQHDQVESLQLERLSMRSRSTEQISPQAWQAWNELSAKEAEQLPIGQTSQPATADPPADERDVRSFPASTDMEGIFTVTSPKELAGSYAVFKESLFAIISKSTELGDPAEIKLVGGQFAANRLGDPKEIIFRPMTHDCPLYGRGIWQYADKDQLQLVLPLDPGIGNINGFDDIDPIETRDFRMSRMDLPSVRYEFIGPDKVEVAAHATYKRFAGRSKPIGFEPSATVKLGPALNEESIVGVWQKTPDHDGEKTLQVLAGGQWVFFNSKTLDNENEKTRRTSGKYLLGKESIRPDILTTNLHSEGIPDVNHRWKLTDDGKLVYLSYSSYPGNSGGPIDVNRAIFIPTHQYQRLDWSAITAPEQLPDKISRDAWKEWKRLNTGEPAANLDNRIFNLTAPIIEESIQGVWKSMHSLPDSEEFWIYSNGKVAVSGGKNSDPEKRGMNHLSGTYTIKPADPHGLDVFVIRHQFSDRVDQKHMIFTKSNLDNLTARIVELAEPGLAPVSKTEYLFNERFQRLDWSAITAPEQLPDKISRDTWQAWKELSADTPKDVSPVPQPLNVQGIDPAMIPSSTLTAESIEGVWKFDLKDKGVWGFRMFENGMSRFFLKPSTGEVLGFNIKTGSPYTLNVANATAQIDFNKFVESGSEGSKCIWRINDDGSLEIAEPFLADGSRPISFGAIPKNAVPLGKMEKVDWSNINHAGQLPDQFTRQAWAAWLELNLARPKTNRELLQGLWRVASVVVDDKPQLLDKWNIDYLAVDGATIHSFRRSDSEVAHSQSPTALDPAQSDQMQLVFGSGDEAFPPAAFSVVGKIRFGRGDEFSFDCVLSGGDAPTELLGKKMTITFERMMSGEEVAELSLEELKKKSPYDFPVLKQFKEIVPEMLPPETLDVETD